MPARPLSRRALLAAAAAAGTLPVLARSTGAAVLTFDSPRVTPFRDPLPVPPVLGGSRVLPMAAASHRFHSEYPASTTWGYGGESYHGPTIEARQGEPLTLAVRNALGRHALAANVDTTLHGTSRADVDAPRGNVHLHGHLSRPEHDGHPGHTFRPGEGHDYVYENGDGARQLWFHDHTMGMTRLNVAAGLSAQYLVRDAFDTGLPGNPLGLPAGEFEIPLQLQDRSFDPNGRLWYRFTPLAPANTWSGTWAGDRVVVNGVVWPRLPVARAVYRFRIVNSGSARFYTLTTRGAAPMYVIGTDHGLLDAPLPVSSLTIAPAERYDVLVDFRDVPAGTRIELRNTAPAPSVDQLLGVGGIPRVMCFDVSGARTGGGVPATLRGGPRQPPRLPPVPAPTRRRVMTLLQLIDLDRTFPPVMMSLNNLHFDTPHAELVRCGTAERWDVVNDTDVDHAIHLHMAGEIRLLNRQAYASTTYGLLNPRPAVGTPWRPSPDPFLLGPPQAPGAHERGPKDVVVAPARRVTRFVVRWPAGDELGFDPDLAFMPGHDGGHAGHEELRGYAWHCHMLDHEDHDMMLPLRLQL